mmetsp:Transcript_174732/g.560436  ORF Transcript_174732/g.560436 Transcript_174732/m.560436 type:complete len:380 (+) Transcript_174732:193-1332(+)
MGACGSTQLRAPGQWAMQEGRLNTALLLSTVFSEKYNGRNMEVGEVAEIFLPTASDPVTCEPGEPRQLRPKLLFRAGCLQASPFLWVGDEEAGDDTLYVCFGPLRQKRQVMKIFSSGSTLEEDVVKCGDSTQVVRVSNYIKSLLDRLWADDRLGERLSAAVAERPGHRVLFAGVSHGAVLAQAAALRFKLTRSDPDAATQTLSGTGQTRCGSGEVTVVSWNGYKWTDAQGAALAGQQLRLLPLALSMVEAGVRLVDSVVEYPAGEFEPMPGVTALDRATGDFFECVVGKVTRNLESMNRMRQLHFAQAVLKAMKMAMVASLAEDVAAPREVVERMVQRSLSRRLSDITTAEESFMSIAADVASEDSDESEDSSAAQGQR